MSLQLGRPSFPRFLVFCCAFSLFLSAPQFCQGQMVASYDYTDKKPSGRLRPPQPPPPLKRLPNGVLLVGGVCGGILSNPPLVPSLVSLDRDSYAFGDAFIFIIQLKAVYSTRVPVRGSMAEIEPSDANLSYDWRPLGISMELNTPNHPSVLVGLLGLYGSKEVPGSEIELKNGEWIELRGKARMEWTNLPHGVLPPPEQKYVLQLPLKTPHEFTAHAFSSRAESCHFNAAKRQETRVCQSAEESGGGNPIHVTVTPKATP